MIGTKATRHASRWFGRGVLLTLGLVGMAAAAMAQEAGDTVVMRGTIKQDLYLAGGTVDMLADVEGDVLAAGGQVSIDNAVSGDVMAVGGNVAIRARVGDDVRVAGGNVTISGPVGDELVAGGGQLLLAPTATVGGRAWLAGGNVQINGKVGKGLKAAGNHIVIAGDITGDVDLYAESIDIEPGAVIRGNLTYYSRQEARIAGGAKITGAVKREPLGPGAEARKHARGFRPVARLVLSVTLMVAGIVLYLLFPTASVGAARTINESPWKSLGLGFAMLAATPLVVLLLCISLFGIWLGLLALAAYLMLWLLGFLTGILTVGDWGLRLIDRAKTATKGWRVLSIVAALLALWIVRFVPVLGSLVAFAILVFGLGALTLYLWRRYVSA
jgi:cytoskeletal protein CcmA (bactofilin family)